MKNIRNSIISLLLLLSLVFSSLTACDFGTGTGSGSGETNSDHVDYVEAVKLDMNSNTLKQEVTVKFFIDGDTTHFTVPASFDRTGVVKARYLAVNTPESTGKIEEWGKVASNFTKEKLSGATSILIESDDDSWNFDGNGRYLVWIWYKTAADAEYRNLNIELLQNGLGVGSSASEGRYGETCVKCIAQAKAEKLYMFSGEEDPTYPYGDAIGVTLKELRTNITEYEGKKVSFEGFISHNSDWTAFIEQYDAETDTYFGIQLFYGYISALTSLLAQGNEVRVVGTVTEFNGTYQVSGLAYQPMRPTDPENTAKLSEGNTPAYTEVTPSKFVSPVTIKIDDETSKDYTSFAAACVSTSVSMRDLVVTDAYTTMNEDSANYGAITLTCKVGDIEVDVRTVPFKNEAGELITEDYFLGKTIDVKGIIDYYDYNNTGNGTYQIKVFSLADIVIH